MRPALMHSPRVDSFGQRCSGASGLREPERKPQFSHHRPQRHDYITRPLREHFPHGLLSTLQ